MGLYFIYFAIYYSHTFTYLLTPPHISKVTQDQRDKPHTKKKRNCSKRRNKHNFDTIPNLDKRIFLYRNSHYFPHIVFLFPTNSKKGIEREKEKFPFKMKNNDYPPLNRYIFHFCLIIDSHMRKNNYYYLFILLFLLLTYDFLFLIQS